MSKKKNGLIIIIVIIFEMLFLFSNFPTNSYALQDDGDLEITIHATLFSDGTEIYEDSLLPLGTYNFFDTPELNTGYYSHDLTRMTIYEVQKIYENSTSEYTNASEHNIGSGLGIQEIETNQTIYEYTTSAPSDTEIEIYMNFTISGTFFQNTADLEELSESGSFDGIYFDNLLNRYYTVDYANKRIYEYDINFNYIEYKSIASTTTPIAVTRGFNNNFYILDTGSVVHKYSPSWVTYYGIVATLTAQDSSMTDLIYEDGYFYTTGGDSSPDARIYKYDSNFNYVSQSTHGSPISHYFDMQSIIYVEQYDKFFVANDELGASAYIYQFSSDLSLDFDGANPVKYSSDIFAPCSEGGLLFDGYSFWGHKDPTKIIYRKTSYNFYNFSTANATNFQYSVLNLNYTQNCSLTSDPANFKVNLDTNKGNCTFVFNSSQLSYYDHINDLIVLIQNMTLEIDKIINTVWLNLFILVNFSYAIYKVPTEIDLKVNNVDVVDQSDNSGFVAFDEFQESLEFTASEESIYFEFNLTSYFTFDIELEIISKTYLRKSFKLLSNHSIQLTRLIFPETLDMLKIYLNNIDWGNNAITYLEPSVSIQVNQISWLEVVMGDEIYIPLSNYEEEGTQNYTLEFESESYESGYDLVNTYAGGFTLEQNNYLANISVYIQATGMSELYVYLFFSEWDSELGINKPTYTGNILLATKEYSSGWIGWEKFTLEEPQLLDISETDSNTFYIGCWDSMGFFPLYWRYRTDAIDGIDNSDSYSGYWNALDVDFCCDLDLSKETGLESYTQITETPRTDINSVEFERMFQANRSFKFWYFEDKYEINSVSLKNNQTEKIIYDFEINNSRYYFEEIAYENDLFIASIDYNPNWVISYEIEINNGTYSKIKVDYQADFNITNVSIVLDLSSSGLYNENWTLNANQSSISFKLTIPMISFTTSTQTFYIEGFSSIPYATLTTYESDQNFNQIVMGNVIDYAYFVDFSKFSTIFLINKSSEWKTYNFYYGSEIYAIETMSTSLVKIMGAGFDPSISDSYIHFTTEPFTTVDFDYTDDIITITIVSALNVENVFFQVLFDPSGVHTLEILQNNTNIYGLSDSGDYEGYLVWYTDFLGAGTTIIKIYTNFATGGEFLIQSILPFIIGGALIGVYYYLKKNERVAKKLVQKIKGLKVFQKKAEKKGLKELEISIKDNKLFIKGED